MCNQALTICANKYIFILNIYTHFYKYKCSNYKLLNVTVSENINICKPSTKNASTTASVYSQHSSAKTVWKTTCLND